jgi:LmbE family N-acetylglucosaminyl deacetylase
MRNRFASPASLARAFALLGLLSMTLVTTSAHAAGPPPQPNAAQLRLALGKLGVVGSVLYVAAHPDDENTALLAYLANGALLRTGYLSITRGDGGQNLIGPEQGPELGIIRTQELLAARRIDGAEQFFTRARDFGYSKSPEETLRIWDKDAVLADVVVVIRRFRPDVIITRFSPEPADTHGHHTASAMLAVEAFRAAADPLYRPEQLTNGVTPWQARRLLWNRATFFAKPGEDFSRYDKLDAGGFNPLLGASYGEIAADSRSMHKSQGFGVARARGPNVEYFSTLAEAPGTARGAVLGGLDFSWGRLPGTAAVRAAIDAVARSFADAAPQASLAGLFAVDAALDGVGDAHWRALKKRDVRELIVACAGLFADATAAEFRATPGAEIEVTATAVARAAAPVTLKEVRFPRAGTETGTDTETVAVGKSLAAAPGLVAAPIEIKRKLKLPGELQLTTPYWLASPPEPGSYAVADPRDIGSPEDQPPLHVDLVFEVDHKPLVVSRSIAYKWTDPVAGERYRPLEITPLVSVLPDTKVLMFPLRGHRPEPLTVRLVAGAALVKGTLRPDIPAGWAVEPPSAPFELAAKGDERELVFQVRRAPERAPVRGEEALPPTASSLRLVAEVGDARFSRGVVHIEHSHIPVQTWLAEAEVRLVPVALEVAGTRIGYIPGPGDDVPASLRRVGYEVTVLGDEALRGGGAALAHFDAIVVGVRAFNTNDRLRGAHALLMKYVEAGGTLVVQYNTNSRLGPLTAPIGPFPFEISHDRVTDEAAAVTFSTLAHPALTTPNKLTGIDFDGWIQERGLYFAGKWDPKYQTPLAMHDPGEKPLSGSLLWAKHGKGTFVYTGLAFFRQLPAGVPGAYRLFANVLAGGKAAAAGKAAHGQ